MNYRHLRFAIALASCFGASVLHCTSGGRAPGLTDDVPDPMGGRSGASGGGGAQGGSNGAGAQDAGSDAGPNCTLATCSGAGRCVEDEEGSRCVCDTGYTLLGTECVVDQECIQLRRLEHGCRLRTAAEPAVGMFFMLETCAGTTVRPEILGDPAEAFKVREDDLDLGEESYATILDRDVESIVIVALDLSESVANDANLVAPLIAEIRTFINAMEPGPGESVVKVGLIVFGRSVHTLRSPTSDFDLLRTDLDALAADPAAAVAEPGGTNLIGAVNAGVGVFENYLENHYDTGDLGSVLKVGTVVSVTDGRDTSGSTLASNTVVNRISIGISSDIDDTELSRVGPQGSYLTPRPSDWAQAFQSVVERVKEFPRRAYLLSYCSPAVDANHRVVVTLANRETAANAICNFNADTFGVGVGSCNAQFVSSYCESRTCGSFLACSACPLPDAGAASQNDDDRWVFGPR